MPGPILHMGATVLCSHGGQAIPTVPSPVVLVSGMPIATIAAPYAVAGCAFVPPAGNGPMRHRAVGGGSGTSHVARATGRDHDRCFHLCPDRYSTAAGRRSDEVIAT